MCCVQVRCISNKNLDKNYSFFICSASLCVKVLEKIVARTLCAMHHGILSLYYIFNNDAYFLDFRAQKFPLIFFNLNPLLHQQALHFGVLNYEKQHKEGTCKVSGRWVIFPAFYADFCLCPKSVIIITLISDNSRVRKEYFLNYSDVI